MLVKLEERYKEFYTLCDLERAKAIIKMEKEDTETARGWASYAVDEALRGTDDYSREVIQATAHTAQNCRAWDEYGEGSAHMDVWIDAIARTQKGFVEVGAYLSDIWQSGAVRYKEHMYIRYFREV